MERSLSRDQESVAKYIEAAETADPAARAAIVGEVLAYNEEDLDATWAVMLAARIFADPMEVGPVGAYMLLAFRRRGHRQHPLPLKSAASRLRDPCPSKSSSRAGIIQLMRGISLFSGAGGLDLGAELAGVRIGYANEIDRDASATLERWFPNTEIDRRSITEIKSFPQADIAIGGYPCQPFSMGGNRNPTEDERSHLYLGFARCLESIQPLYFVAENVSGLKKLRAGKFLTEQFETFSTLGRGYRITAQIVDAKEFGLAQTRKRLFLVGVRRDLAKVFVFPRPTHGVASRRNPYLKPFVSHGEVIKHLPIWPKGDFYERPHDPEGHFSWYYMSRNRKANWDGPSYTIVANWRHVTLHPASPVMKLTWSNLADGWKQRWDFSDQYEHLAVDRSRPILPEPRRLSWRECSLIQTFSEEFEPVGDTESKFRQIGNAVPPQLARILIEHLVSGDGLFTMVRGGEVADSSAPFQTTLWV